MHNLLQARYLHNLGVGLGGAGRLMSLKHFVQQTNIVVNGFQLTQSL